MQPIDPVELAEKVIGLLDSANYSTTYKWATLDAVVQVITENVLPNGELPTSISGKAVGSKVLDIYWRQSVPFTAHDDGSPHYLKQSNLGSGKNDIPGRIAAYRAENGLMAINDSLSIARKKDTASFHTLERSIQATVIRMPLPKLQRFGEGTSAIESRFLYDYSWVDEVAEGKVHQPTFNDNLTLKPGVAEGLIKIQGLLRPYIENLWIQWVANKNKDITDAGKLQAFLFGVDRKSLVKVKPHLVSLQNEKCFYCNMPFAGNIEVDHFLPFSKHADDTLDNLVASCRKCNGSKSDSYASLAHLEKWRSRFVESSSEWAELNNLAETIPHLRDASATLAKARAVYLNKPEGTLLWNSTADFALLNHTAAHALLTNANLFVSQSHP